ncbi:MAG: thioredoxin domain-containing protein [Rhodospirillaceae bacterium]|nr:MAG: thioredoxin domain-containing protein [Rhodospirillaceae bacterium]
MSPSPTAADFLFPPGRNRLGAETSPYLLQHKDNPVHWWAWGPEALAAARHADRPILLSVGYSACHWCHVMAHESFEDPAVAEVMNRLYVNIKVDREERPDLDAIYQKALALMGEHGGWPLTMFITPDGKPFWGGTYFPPRPAYGRPSFTDVLTQLDRAWRDMRDEITRQTAALTAAIAKRPDEYIERGLTPGLLNDIANQILPHLDNERGGLQGAPKFPMPFAFEFLWRQGWRDSSPALRDAVMLTLEAICQGGIYDHVGGGFARYSTDARWLAPHFEKMLYDNAQLIDLLTLVWRKTRAPLFAARVAETVTWLLREMVADNGAFAAALDADSDGEEGAFYVWTEGEIDALLGADAPAFKAAYDVRHNGNWEDYTILNRSGTPFGTVDEDHMTECREVLLEAREARVRPGRDHKALTDWNGLTIAALAHAGMVFDKPDWIGAAQRAFAAVCDTMVWKDADGRARLGHAWCGGRLQQTAMVDDYANMANAALVLYGVTGDGKYLARAEQWVNVAGELYWDENDGGYFFTACDGEDLIVRTKTANDAATPSGNGAMVAVLAKLFYLTGDENYRERAEAAMAPLAVEAVKSFPHGATLLSGADLLEQAVQVVIAGHRDSPEARAMLRAAHRAADPHVIVALLETTDELPRHHPAHGKERINGRATAYICRGPVCDAPVTDVAALEIALAS